MRPKKTQTTKKNYISGPDKLQCITGKFRASLKEWRDENDEPKDGGREPLLCASITEVLNYAMEYTNLWMPIPDEQKEDFKHDWFIDCRDLYISFSPLDLISVERISIPNWAPVKFDNSVILARYYLFVGKIFLGYAHFYGVEFRGDTHFNEAQFHGEVKFDHADFSREALFKDCEFKSKVSVSFQQTTFSRRVDFANACFKRAPIFHETKLPQASSFNGATFNKTGKGLSQQEIHQEVIALRTLRQIAASYKDQQDESMFFALEQRYYRKVCLTLRLVWQKESYKTPLLGQQGLKDLFVLDTWRDWRYWKYCFIRWKPIEWFISWAYDSISEYGSNPSRAVGWLFSVNIIAGLLYQVMCDLDISKFTFSENSSLLAKQNPAVFFGLQNLFNPSAIVSNKALLITNNPFMLVLAVVQFCGTYIVLILTALAIRNRFQKGGSDK